MGLANHLRRPGNMIVMRLAVEQNLGVAPTKPQPLYACPDLSRGTREVCVDEDISFGRDNQITGQVLAPHVVQVVRTAERSNWSRPRRVLVSKDKLGAAG